MNIYRYKVLVDRLQDIIPLLEPQHEEYFKELLKRYVDKIDQYNKKNKFVINISKTELGLWSTCCKKVISAYFKNNGYFNEEVDKTPFTESLKNSKILLNRYWNSYAPTPLEDAINKTIKLEIIKEFKEHNKQIL